MMWIDSHCHLNAPEFDVDRLQVIARAKSAGVRWMVIPAVAPEHFDIVMTLAHKEKQPYALGIHPLWMQSDGGGKSQKNHDQQWINALATKLKQCENDPYLVAVGEIGLDYFMPDLNAGLNARHNAPRQWFFYIEQLKLAQKFGLPVILHVRRSADMLLKGLRQVGGIEGIVHAFNGSKQQTQQFIALRFKLGFGGTATFERASQVRHLLKTVPMSSIVLETDAPDMLPHWIYKTVKERVQGKSQGRNEPAELVAIAKEVAVLRGVSLGDLACITVENTMQALPKLQMIKS